MTPDTLRAAGEALHGARWHAALARDLGVSLRTLFRWDREPDRYQPPPGIAADLRRLLDDHVRRIRTIQKQLG